MEADNFTKPYIIDTASGERLDLNNPLPENIQIEDVAGELSKVCRFGAQGHLGQRPPGEGGRPLVVSDRGRRFLRQRAEARRQADPPAGAYPDGARCTITWSARPTLVPARPRASTRGATGPGRPRSGWPSSCSGCCATQSCYARRTNVRQRTRDAGCDAPTGKRRGIVACCGASRTNERG